MRGYMKTVVAQLINTAVGAVAGDDFPSLEIERTRDARHGHFACNIALQLARTLQRSPREIASSIVAALPASDQIAAVEIAGPGFINFRLTHQAFTEELRQLMASGEAYGQSDMGSGQRVLLEYVSANPTGPLHVGHGRHAAFGACLANLLTATGHSVHREYYVNDAGRQMDILALSVWLRWLQATGNSFEFPSNAYQGDYITPIAAAMTTLQPQPLRQLPPDFFSELAENEDVRLDTLIARARDALGEAGFDQVLEHVLDAILTDIRDDLADFGVTYDEWYSERSLSTSGAVQRALSLLEANAVTYRKEGAVWFRATDYGDEKDRVVVRDNGRTTYFASDIAYHLHKRERGFDRLIDVLGADHHGYIARVRAGLEAMGQPGDCLRVELVQFVALYRGGEKAQMSTRSGEFVTLRQLREEVGNDAARLFFVLRSNEQHLDFDLDLATSSSNDNPVYYLQYAYARACSVMNQLAERQLDWDAGIAAMHLHLLTAEHEQQLLLTLTRYPEIIEAAALQLAPQHLVYYLKDLAREFHAYYNAHKFIVDESGLRNARLMLVLATRQVIQSGLRLLGVSTPEHM